MNGEPDRRDDRWRRGRALSAAVAAGLVATAACGTAGAEQQIQPVVSTSASASASSVGWQVRPSFKYDVLCLLNVLTGDPYYLNYYADEYARFEPDLTPAVRAALANVQRAIKTEGGGIVSATLTLYFSVVGDSTLAQMSARLDDPESLRRRLEATPYFGEESWRRFESVTGDLRVIFDFLSELGYEEEWAARQLPDLRARARELEARLPEWSLLSQVARLTGMPERPAPVEIIVLHFNQPHGIRITGTRYLTYSGWPLRIVLNDAIHEMLHPPYDLDADPELRRAIEGLRASEFLMDRVENHDPSLGYNTLEGLIEEDVVQAFEQLLAERAGIADEPRERWRTSDGGIHVFAAALYHLLRLEGYEVGDETIGRFLRREIAVGALRPGHVRTLYEDFYTAPTHVGTIGRTTIRPPCRRCGLVPAIARASARSAAAITK
jgi:hypothetical protein